MNGFKTLAASALISILGVLQQAGLIDIIPDNYQGVAVAGIGFVMAALRMVTKTAPLKAD